MNIKLDEPIYIGDENTNGSFKIFVNNHGALEIQKRIEGEWTFCGSYDA